MSASCSSVYVLMQVPLTTIWSAGRAVWARDTDEIAPTPAPARATVRPRFLHLLGTVFLSIGRIG